MEGDWQLNGGGGYQNPLEQLRAQLAEEAHSDSNPLGDSQEALERAFNMYVKFYLNQTC